MSGIWGNKFKVSIFGESHGKAIGVVLDGVPSGIELDFDYISTEMKRRAPGKNKISTSRKEDDQYEIMSGVFNGKTTGTPLCALIWNKNQHSKDYEVLKNIMRPGHADYTGYVKYNGFNDYRGGGHFSGRLTAPIVFAGSIARQILKEKEIIIGSHIKSIGRIHDESFDRINMTNDILGVIRQKKFAVINDEAGLNMEQAIIEVKEEEDSLGGIIETAILNLPTGIGAPFFDSVESRLSSIMFSIPGVKGVEFGAGFDIVNMKGSEANDEYYIENDDIKTYTNNNGGILGGITNGMPIIFRTAIKPTPSIGKLQKTININEKRNTEVEIEGRHDPCIVPRAIPVIEAATAIAILDMII